MKRQDSTAERIQIREHVMVYNRNSPRVSKRKQAKFLECLDLAFPGIVTYRYLTAILDVNYDCLHHIARQLRQKGADIEPVWIVGYKLMRKLNFKIEIAAPAYQEVGFCTEAMATEMASRYANTGSGVSFRPDAQRSVVR